MKKKSRKKIDILTHFKRIILRDIKPLSFLITEETKYLGTFTSFWPHMFNFIFTSINNKIRLLHRLSDPDRVQKEIISDIVKYLDQIEKSIHASKTNATLKATALASVATANFMLERYDKGEKQLDHAITLLVNLDSPVKRSQAIRDVLYFLGSINKLTKREELDIPDSVLQSITTKVSKVLEKNIVEAELLRDPFKRAQIYNNLGFGSRMFHVVVTRDTHVEWFDINQAQRLALDALDEAEKIGDWFKKNMVIADAATVLAISGDDTVNLAATKFDDVVEVAFRRLDESPLKSAYLLGRVAYDKAYTRFYMDSDKYFFESIAILLEADSLDRTIPYIAKILKLAGKARYFYVIYEVIRDWLLPAIDSEPDMVLRARLLAISSHLALPVSISWSISIARESVSLIKHILEYELLPSYDDYVLVERPIRIAQSLISLIPNFVHASYSLPQESAMLVKNIVSFIERALNLNIKSFARKKHKSIDRDLLYFTKSLGRTLASLKQFPLLAEKLESANEFYFGNLRRVLSSYYGSSSFYVSLPMLYYAYGLSTNWKEKAREILSREINALFKFEKNLWAPRDSKLIDALKSKNYILETYSDLLRLLVEIGHRVNEQLNSRAINIIIDLSELLDQKTYTKLFVSILEKIKDKQIAKYLLINVLDVLIDEEKISKRTLPRKFYRIVRTIDSAYAKLIMEELT